MEKIREENRISMEGNIYLYCIISELRDNVNFETYGHEKSEIFTIHYSDLCAVVSGTLKTSYEPVLENLQCHENVISEIMKKYDVLPMSFSTISKNKNDITDMLKKYYDQFKANLNKTVGKVEMGVKIFYKFNFEEEDKEDITSCKNGKDYMKIRYERHKLRKKLIESILDPVDNLHDMLITLSDDNYSSRPMKNNLIFNGAYLVCKEKVNEFLNILKEEEKKYSTYKIIYSGPWSPYHFVRIIKEGENNGKY